jgi:hypothetical protein
MASVLKLNTLTGASTAGSISVTGEGNSTTTNLQQGLAKAWNVYSNSSGVASTDSLNVSGMTDHGTGDNTTSYTNSFSAAKAYTFGGFSSHSSDVTNTIYTVQGKEDDSMAAGSTRYVNLYNSASACAVADYAILSVVSHGDLA